MSGITELRMALDPVLFAERLGLSPDDWQADLLRSDSRRVLLNCSRQAGKSTVSAVLALHRALYYPDSLILVLAPSERQSKELFSKILDFYRALGKIAPKDALRKLGLVLSNGSRVEALPGTEKTVRGFSGASLLVVDEASRIDDSLYFAVRPMLAVSGGTLMMLSTPYGRRGIFYEEWTNGEGWQRYEILASECPRISPEFLEEERRALPARIYRQEYCCSFEETEDAVFTTDEISDMFVDDDDVAPLFAARRAS